MIIITGGSGFIGSCLASELCQKNDIVIVDNFNESEKWKNLRGKKLLDLWTCDEFYDKINKNAINDDCEIVIHLGAKTSTVEKDMNLLFEKNFQASKKIYEFCLENNVRFIYASSAAVYGNAFDGFQEESLKIPENPYGFSKLIFDQWTKTRPQLRQCVGLRFFNVYGPNEYHKGIMSSVILHFYNEILQNGSVNIFKSYNENYDDGEAKRDFVYVKDIVKVISYFVSNYEYNGIYNVGTETPRSYNDLARILFKEMGLNQRINYIDMISEIKNSYQYITKSDISKLRAIGYNEEFMSLEQGIHDYVNNYLIPKKFL